MKKNDLFIEFESINEFEEWFNKQKITRPITRLQIHHMDLPDYDCWEQDKKRWGENAALNRTLSLNSYGKSTWGSGAYDGHGHYIAQHLNFMPDGSITTGRNLNSTPIGIKAWNTNAICCEIYGDFDRGKDVMTKAQAQSVIAAYAIMAKKLNIPIDDNHIRPHCWHTASGTYLGGYYPSKSCKTCPGERFMGIGNTHNAFEKYLYNWIKDYMKDKSFPVEFGGKVKEEDKTPVVPIVSPKPTEYPGKYIVRYLQTCMNRDYVCKLAIDGSFGKLTQAQVEKHYLKKGSKGEHVTWLQKALVNRGYKLKVDGSFGNETLEALKQYQKSRKLTVDGCCGLATHKAIIND